jgi:hypothetical protein
MPYLASSPRGQMIAVPLFARRLMGAAARALDCLAMSLTPVVERPRSNAHAL